MVTAINSTIEMTGNSGNKYLFNLFDYKTFDDLRNAFRPISAIYLFTRRSVRIGRFEHDLVYLGETSNLSDRFNNHHKAESITKHGANCIGIFVCNCTDLERQFIERDILLAYDFPCNILNN